MQRVLSPEWLDDPSIDEDLHTAAHAGLRRINAWSQTSRFLRRALAQVANHRGVSSLSVLDVACGSGDLARTLAARPLRGGVRLTVEGCDISPQAISQARDLAERIDSPATFYQHDAIGAAFPKSYDVVLCTLFLHHLTDSEAVTLLRRMAAACTSAVMVDDLVRSRAGYWLAWTGCRLLSRCPVVHNDGPVSVEGAFRPDEALGLAAQAGLDGAAYQRHWPQRYLMTWRPT